METFGTFILAALALTGSPGPNTLSLAAVGAAFGRVRGFRYMIGLNLGVFIVIGVVGSGVSGLVLAIPGAAPVIAILAALYFMYLAYRIATAPPVQQDQDVGNEPKWYEGVVVSLLNPKAYAAMAALFSSFTLISGDHLSDSITKALALGLTIMFVNACWLYAGSILTTYMTQDRSSRIINIVFASLLIISVIAAAFL